MFSSLVLVLGALLIVPVSIQVHGQSTGTVCIIPTSAGSCPSSSPTVSSAVGSQLRVSIFIQNSAPTNGFQVILLADHTILKPAGANLTGTVLVAPQQIIAECLGGVLTKGSGACSTVDTPDTLEFVVTGAPAQFTVNPTTGLLFTAIYNVTSSTAGTPLGFQTGCTNTSVSGGTCVTIASGATTPDPENVQTATFSTNTSPSFTITANPSSLNIVQGSCGTSSLSVNSVNGFSGSVFLTSSVSPAGPTSTLSPTSVSVPAGGSASSTLTVCSTNSTPTGSYQDTVTGTSGSFSFAAPVSVTMTSPPPPPDFTITVSPSSQTVQTGSTANFVVTITGLNGFSGTVSLTATISPMTKHPPTTSLVPSTVGPGSTSTLSVIADHGTTVSTYTATVTGTSGSLTHSASVTVIVTH